MVSQTKAIPVFTTHQAKELPNKGTSTHIMVKVTDGGRIRK